MPWKVVEQEGRFCVVKEADGSTEKCYDDKGEAEDYLKALYASEDKAVDEEPVTEEPPSEVATVEVPEGITQVVLKLPTAAAVEKSLTERIWEGIKTRLGWNSADSYEATGIKVAGNRWLAVYSNNFEDRDGEIFTTKAIDDYVARVDTGAVPPPELWVWHLPGTRIGQADWVDRHGHFVMAMGTFDDTSQGQKARDHYATQAGKKNLSHGYKYAIGAGYAKGDFDGTYYHKFNTFEISLLPRGTEANMFTSLEGVKTMAKELTEAKKAEIFTVFGEEDGKRILENLNAKGKALEDLGVAFKEFTGDSSTTPEEAAKGATEQAQKQFGVLLEELISTDASVTNAVVEVVKQAKAMKDDNALMRKEIDDLRQEMDLRPRIASQDDATAIDTSKGKGKELLDTVEKQMAETDKFWGTTVVKS